ncbi:MAG: universal stress protein [Bradymonadales bacterium]|nr:universal stress protein [Bradymonadales bacterium]
MIQQDSATALARTVITALALSPRSAAVAAEGYRWAKLLGADLVLLHVGDAGEETRNRLEAIIREQKIERARIEFRFGKPGPKVARAAQELKADLVVAGALEKEGALSYYVGSVARQIARQAPCSVLLLTQPTAQPLVSQRWVVTTRHDDVTRQMLRLLSKLAEQEQPRRIDVVSEYQICGAGLALDGDLDDRSAMTQREGFLAAEQERLADFLAATAFGGPNVHPVCLCGRIGYESAEYARQVSADLLFTPAPRRLRFWDRFFQYGVEYALESLPCSLWLYRPVRTEEGQG